MTHIMPLSSLESLFLYVINLMNTPHASDIPPGEDPGPTHIQ